MAYYQSFCKKKITSKELASKFEVSRRTILRDVDALSTAGIPIRSEQGQGGGISIMEGYKVDRTVLSSEDMKAILTGLQSLDSNRFPHGVSAGFCKVSEKNAEKI